MKFHRYADKIILEIKSCIEDIRDQEVGEMIGHILRAKNIYCDGLGKSGLVADSFAMRLSQMNFHSFVVSGCTTTAITDQDVLIIGSGSGETPSLVGHARRAAEIGAKVILITTNPLSRIGEISDLVVEIPAPAKSVQGGDSIQPMGTLFEQTLGVFFDSLVLMLMDEKAVTVEEMYKNHNNLE